MCTMLYPRQAKHDVEDWRLCACNVSCPGHSPGTCHGVGGYPVCRDARLRAFQESIALGTDEPFVIETPLMWLSKAQTWDVAQEVGGEALVHILIEETHTCYKGERGTRYDWGYGCGECPACELRAKGYWEWQASSSGRATKAAK